MTAIEVDYPDDRKYHEEHDWAMETGDGMVEFGITWHAQDALGDIVFFDPPDVGTEVKAGASYGELESVKAVSDLIAPLDGEVVEVNSDIVSQPEKVNEDPYSAWLVRVKLTTAEQMDSLMSSHDYQKML